MSRMLYLSGKRKRKKPDKAKLNFLDLSVIFAALLLVVFSAIILLMFYTTDKGAPDTLIQWMFTVFGSEFFVAAAIFIFKRKYAAKNSDEDNLS